MGSGVRGLGIDDHTNPQNRILITETPKTVLSIDPKPSGFWRGVRAVEGARLESVCSQNYRGFESHPLRLKTITSCEFRIPG